MTPMPPDVPSTIDRLTSGRLDRAQNSWLGPARARWNDYLGTAAADDSGAVLNSRSLYEIAGIDRDRWTVVGIDLSLGPTKEQVVLYAVDRLLQPEHAAEETETAVTAFELGSQTPAAHFLREAFQKVTVRLVSTLAANAPLRVDQHVQLSVTT